MRIISEPVKEVTIDEITFNETLKKSRVNLLSYVIVDNHGYSEDRTSLYSNGIFGNEIARLVLDKSIIKVFGKPKLVISLVPLLEKHFKKEFDIQFEN